jgi:outer membrane protein TolC
VKANLEGQINIQNQMADVALANLKFQMGLPLNDEIILTDKLDNLKSSANISAENTFDPKNRIEYELLNTAITLKGYDVKQKRSGYFPTLAGFLSYGWNAQAEKFTDIFKTQTQANPDGSTSKISSWYAQGLVGLSLKIPIFDSGMKWAQIKQAKLEQQKTRNDFENFKNAAELQFKAAKSGLTSALNDETNTQKTVELSKKIFSKNEIKFKQGAGSSFELVQSETDYITNQLKHIQSVMNLLNAKADLDKATGTK